MAARSMGGIGEIQIVAGSGTKQNRIGDFGLIRMTQVIYKMRGFNASTGRFEHWVATNPAAGPPGGLSLQNIVIAAVITQKELG